MSAEDNLSPQFLYHHAPVQSRGFIRANGLRASVPSSAGGLFGSGQSDDSEVAPEEIPHGVYLMPLKSEMWGHALDHYGHNDVWRVHAAGLHHLPDPADPQHQFRYSPEDIGPGRVSLVRGATDHPQGNGLGPHDPRGSRARLYQ